MMLTGEVLSLKLHVYQTTMADELDPRILTIAKKLKEMRIAAGFSSHEKFAYDYDIGRVQYWRIENGANITLVTLLKVLDAHEVSLKDFFASLDDK